MCIHKTFKFNFQKLFRINNKKVKNNKSSGTTVCIVGDGNIVNPNNTQEKYSHTLNFMFDKESDSLVSISCNCIEFKDGEILVPIAEIKINSLFVFLENQGKHVIITVYKNNKEVRKILNAYISAQGDFIAIGEKTK